ncbi:hypothetical protein [Proteocatella sphenisci]|uniref:hypothetical protein n=1 Tax=Proteocatella sphenisci TaxID=181070 RepID=UPI0004B48EC9|nr:hypothetical protein [Proteocatella sphenisci]
MIDFIYSKLYSMKGKKGYLIIYRIVKLILNIYYPLHSKYSNREYNCKNENVIISLTTFPARINKVWLTIESLMRQTVRPQKIILWLAESQFESRDELPKRLLALQKYGLEIKFCDDLRSHKKYYYSMLHHPEKIIVTVDDDTFYPESLLENLLETHKKYPESVCCNLAHAITFKDGKINKYSEWKSGSDGVIGPSHNIMPIGCQGVLYPPNLLNENLFDKNQIKELCPLADDIWLKAMATINNVRTVKVNSNSITYVDIIAFRDVSLTKVNVGQNLNDKQIRAVLDRYPEVAMKWSQE